MRVTTHARLVLIEDDERLARQMLPGLAEAGYPAQWAPTAAEGLEAVKVHDPDLILLDLMLPDGSGYDVLKQLRQTTVIPVIVLTARLLGQDKVRALDLGADDYLTKPFWIEELCARIRAVLRRGALSPTTPECLRFGAVEVDMGAQAVRVNGRETHLTPTEFGILAYLVRRPGRVVLREHLIDAVIPGEDSAFEALQAHMSRLRRKLGADGQVIATLRGMGYRFTGQLDGQA
ncbi:MAG: response regulator transcription factor [Bradymonadia bacterium]